MLDMIEFELSASVLYQDLFGFCFKNDEIKADLTRFGEIKKSDLIEVAKKVLPKGRTLIVKVKGGEWKLIAK